MSDLPETNGHRQHTSAGGTGRALAWLFAGVVVFALVLLAIAPEVVTAERTTGEVTIIGDTLLTLGIAAVPGLLLLLGVVLRRRQRVHDREG